MTDYPHLNHAPIAEAILDMRVVRQGTTALEATQRFAEGIKADFPDRRPVQTMAAVVEMGLGKPTKAKSQTAQLGWICWNEAKTRAVQARTDGFSINHVRRYGSWDELRELARTLWPRYVEAVRPQNVVRIALRYINQLDFSPDEDIADQLHTKPLLARDLPQRFGESFMRVDLPFEGGRHAFITEATQLGTAEHSGPRLLLDIDAYVQRPLGPTSPEIWDELDALHDIKNDCFFRSVREETWRRYQ